MVLNSTNVVLVRWYVALLKISNPSGFISRTPRMLRMPGLPASGPPVLRELHHRDAQVPLFHYRSQIRLHGSSLLSQILLVQTFLAKSFTSVCQRLKNRVPDFSKDRSRFKAGSLDSNYGMSFQNLELLKTQFLANQLKNSI
jgi:hypothetical protein